MGTDVSLEPFLRCGPHHTRGGPSQQSEAEEQHQDQLRDTGHASLEHAHSGYSSMLEGCITCGSKIWE
jgi:hypothetical protein